eukprot:GEMP01041482.1.p1 GENE.GEMP01041482.1~~GEMP01041482.1.p1  ORF type:complete len:235 (+),score=25.39 GEMP01041482.1:50-706(+)
MSRLLFVMFVSTTVFLQGCFSDDPIAKGEPCLKDGPKCTDGTTCKSKSDLKRECTATSGADVCKCMDVVGLSLIGGNSKSEGNVHVDGLPVCDDGWNDHAALVVCKMLGYTRGISVTDSLFGNVAGVFSMDNVVCNGNETDIKSCGYNTQHIDCNEREAAGVRCGTIAIGKPCLKDGLECIAGATCKSSTDSNLDCTVISGTNVCKCVKDTKATIAKG